jgi:hypothetical protein
MDPLEKGGGLFLGGGGREKLWFLLEPMKGN